MTRIAAIAAVALLSLSAASAARAQAVTTTVSTQGYDLSTHDGAKAFYARLSRAVSAGCGGAPTSFFGSEEETFQTCYRQGMADAVAKTRAPLVAALNDKTPRTQMASR